ncbi:MAG TPA: hypothetical protein VFP05_17240 [Thermomicrobiales bacterium]|nr:hypothetical protein [Thermomicrobiales bacterium]
MRRVRFVVVLLCAVLAAGVLIQPASTAAVQSTATPEESGVAQVEPDSVLADALFVSHFGDPNTIPLNASADLPSGEFQYMSSGVHLSEFFADAAFVTPPSTPIGSWTIGFAFWDGDDQSGSPSDFFMQARDGVARWGFGQKIDGTYRILQQGNLAPGAIDFTPGARNFMSLVVAQGFAILCGDDRTIVATVDLGGATGLGDVEIEAEYQADDPATTQTLPAEIPGFVVWDLSPEAMAAAAANATTPTPTEPAQNPISPTVAPQPTQGSVQPTQAPVQPTQAPALPSVTASAGGDALLTQVFEQERSVAMASSPIASLPPGTLQQQTAGISFEPAGVSLANVYVTATFDNPADLSTSFDIALGFRDLNNDTEFRFVVSSDGGWALSIGTGAPVVQGTATNFDASAGGSNTLEIVAQGAIGLLAIDGVVVQQVDLSGNLSAGDVYVASGMYDTYTVEGRQIPYSSFAVYQLPS